MTIMEILEALLLGPLKLVFEVIFQIAHRFIGHPGLAIVVLSLIMNILVLPLYKRADAMQEASRDIENKLRKGVAHIKKTFTGDERMMILQTYYRQNNYKPTQALNGSISLFLEIPFFMAAYQFLSHLQVMEGVSLGPISDLSQPDGLLWGVNLLPILMTLVNVISSAIYLKGFPLKTKIQLYGMALFFLVFRYESPACLVFYWTLNNLFSLIKTIFYKLKNPKKVLSILLCAAGLGLLVLGIAVGDLTVKRKVFLIGVGVAMQLPLVAMLLKGKLPAIKSNQNPKPNKAMFLMGSVFLTVLVGLLIPSTFIAASPQEYVDYTMFYNPLWYIASATCLAAGTFLVWLRVFYWLASPKGKVLFDRLVWVLCGVMLVNYMFFGTKLGVISNTLQYERGVSFSAAEYVLNVAVLAALASLMYLIACKWKKVVTMVLLTAAIAIGGMSALNIYTAKTSVDEVVAMQKEKGTNTASFELSTTGKNVIVLMLDRGLGLQVPYLMEEKPELKEQFKGFTYYSNTISFGGVTNFASPSLFGGYEYTPVELNKRKDESLASKQNEALKVMPVIFSENGYDVTVCDPVYANYQWVPDLSIFDEYPDIDAYITKGKFSDPAAKRAGNENNKRNFFCFSIMKTMPLVVQPTIYNNGLYNQAQTKETKTWSVQTQESISVATGNERDFIDSYNVLCNLPSITKITDENKNTYMSMVNDTTHEPQLLQTPDYTPADTVDNTEYDAARKADAFTLNGRTMHVDSAWQMSHYQVNMAAFLKLGEWFDYLRENGVWDNTRIILVSDHGKQLYQFDELVLDDRTDLMMDAEVYCPILMVKDFGSQEFTQVEDFMTNADVPTLAFEGLVENPVNPFTGKAINSDEKTAHDQFIIASLEWDVNKNNGNTFAWSRWISVKDNIWQRENWTVINEIILLDEHKNPTLP